MFGFYGRMMTIDLSSHTFEIDDLDDGLLSRTLGGKGLATHLLLERNRPGVDPLAPENHIVVATGPFCNSRLWGGSRYGIYTKSPLTHRYAESYSGGHVPEAIDAAGFDAVIFKGRSQAPVVVVVNPDGAEFKAAEDLWGMEVYDAEEQAVARFGRKKETGQKIGAMVIGPAGEKQVNFALVANDKWRCAGRAGTGAVFGSKQLKAVVFKGDRTRQWADPEGIKAYAARFAKTHVKSPGVQAYKNMGTTMMVGLMNTVGAFPARYWNQGTCDHWEKISGETYHKDHEVTPHACAKCFMACGRMARIASGRHKGLKIEGPEYETIYAFGGLCMIEDMAEIAYLNDLCDRLGVDTITAGNLCGLVMEAWEHKRIDYKLEYGDARGTARLIRLIVHQEGIGAVLAKGIVNAARQWQLEDLAVHVKGMEPAGYDPRVLKGMGLTFGTSPRGACHLRTTFYKPELAGMIPADTTEGKAELLIDYEDRLNIFDTLVLCRFYRDMYTWEELETTLALTTGKKFSTRDLRQMAAGIADMTRRFNINEGLTPEEDRLPSRLHKHALPTGQTLTAQEMETMLTDYYALRGWSPQGEPA